MEILRKTAIAALLFLQAAFLLQLGCAGTTSETGNFAAPPAPVAELPSVLQIPKDLSIDVNKTRMDGGAIMFASLGDPYLDEALSKFLTAGSGVCGDGALDTGEQCDDGMQCSNGIACSMDAECALIGDGLCMSRSGDGCSTSCQIENYSENLAFSANLVFFANSRLAALLGPLSTFLIPVDATLNKMEKVIFIGTKPYIARLNFGDFDLDGIGGAEGCSGHTAALPICVRIWVDDGVVESRLLAARFDDFPLPTNPGSGSLRGQDLTFAPVGSVIQVAANYDHFDPEDKFTDSFFGALVVTPPLPPEVFLPIRAFASQLGPNATALKTSNGSATDMGNYAKGFGRWLENQDYWLGSFESNDPPPRQFTNQCVRISTGEGVSFEAFCKPLGLNTTGLGFLPFTSASDLMFFDFPEFAP